MLRHLLIGLTASSALLVSAQYEDLNGITPKACKASRQCTPLEQCPEMIELHRAYKTSTGRTYTKLRTDFVENVCQLDTHVHVCCNEIPEEIPLQFNQLTFHDLAGEVQYIDENTLVITDFVYDGKSEKKVKEVCWILICILTEVSAQMHSSSSVSRDPDLRLQTLFQLYLKMIWPERAKRRMITNSEN